MRRVLVIWEPSNDTVRQRAIDLADQLALPLAQPDDIPPDALLLVVTKRRLELRGGGGTESGSVFVDFVSDSARSRRLPPRGGKELIARAIGLKHKPLFIIDATAGWAHDAFVLAQLGCRVRAIERSPVVVALVANGITRARAALRTRIDDALDRLTIEVGDARNVLSLFGVSAFRMAGPDAVSDCRERTQKKEPTTNKPGRPSARVPHGPTSQGQVATDTTPDVVYLDPMYPVQRKSALNRKDLRMLRALVGEDGDARGLLETARGVARRRVVVKRPRHASPLAPDPDIQYKGSSVRFDVYLPGPGARA